MQESLIVTVGNVKGGVGKTTLAVSFAICQALQGRDVLLVDGDEQGTARTFTQLRAELLGVPGYTAVSLRGPEIRIQLRQLRTKYESIIVDVGGRDTASLRAALTVTDILVVPVLPASCEKEGFDYFPHPIIRRKAFRNAAAAGLSVIESRPSDERPSRNSAY